MPVKTKPVQPDAPTVCKYPEGQKYATTDCTECIVPRVAPEGAGAAPQMTLYKLFEQAVEAHGEKTALATEPAAKIQGPAALPWEEWQKWTWAEYHADCKAAAKGFADAGMELFGSVTVFGFNAPQWMIAAMGAILAGGKVAGIYPTDTAEQVCFKVKHSGSAVAAVEDKGKVDRIIKVLDELPKLNKIVTWGYKDERASAKRADGTEVAIVSWDEFIAASKGLGNDDEMADRRKKIQPGNCAALIYTSGTTGNPKAVMISHDNIIFEAGAVFGVVTTIGSGKDIDGNPDPQERVLSYLPLSHVAGMMVDIVSPLQVTGAGRVKEAYKTTYFARATDLKEGTIGARLQFVRPTIFLGVPRVWEKIAEKLKAIGAQTKGLKKKIVGFFKSKALAYQTEQQMYGTGAKPAFTGLALKKLKAIKEKLGLQCCKYAFTGAAPIARDLLEYYGSLGINVNEVYGMSECTGATTVSTDESHVWGSVGWAFPGTEVAIMKVDDLDNNKKERVAHAKDLFAPAEAEQGEICFRGRHIMMGYMANPDLGEEHVAEITKKTEESIDKEGWLHSGDKGTMNAEGLVRITGRYKELIIGAGGENIAPVPIEDEIKKLCPAISNIMMVGDKRKYNTALVTLKAEGATGELAGTDQLTGPALDVVQGVTTISQAMESAEFQKAIHNVIAEVNKNPAVVISNACKIQKFKILPKDFSVEGEEFTPTLKLKRGFVQDKYKDVIDTMYAD